MMIRKITILSLLIIVPLVIQAQQEINRSLFDTGSSADFMRPQYRLDMGSSFNYSQLFGSASTFTVSPSVMMPVSKRFSVRAGIIASTTFMPGISGMQTSEIVRQRSGINNIAVYGSTIYQMSPNLTFYGSGIKQLTPDGLPLPYISMPQSSFMFGSNYKIGKNVTIGASVNFSQYSGIYSPFYNNSPFSPQPW